VGDASDVFYDRIDRIDGLLDYVTEEPWNYSESEQTPEDRALRDIVLPPLIDVCRSPPASPDTANT
jgi:hypothetical protein